MSALSEVVLALKIILDNADRPGERTVFGKHRDYKEGYHEVPDKHLHTARCVIKKHNL